MWTVSFSVILMSLIFTANVNKKRKYKEWSMLLHIVHFWELTFMYDWLTDWSEVAVPFVIRTHDVDNELYFVLTKFKTVV